MHINICFITDASYVLPTCVSITSLIKNKKRSSIIDIFVVGTGLDENQLKLFEQLKTHNVNILVNNVVNKYDQVNTKHGYVSKAAMLKFDLPKLFPNLDKILYLDSDTLVLTDLSELYKTDIQNKYAAVVSDMSGCYQGNAKKFGFDNYFNSGMMLLNLKKMRKDGISDKLLYAKEHDNYKHFMDQDAFNEVLGQNVIYLSPKWNYMKANLDFSDFQIADFFHITLNDLYKIISGPHILHLTNTLKPWIHTNAPCAEIWNKYYEQYIAITKSKVRRFLFYRHIIYPNGRHKFYVFGLKMFSYKPCFAQNAKIKGNFWFSKEILPNGRRHIYICGIKVASYNASSSNTKANIINNTYNCNTYENKNTPVLWQIQRVARLHYNTFTKYKNIHNGQDVVILCTGPSLNTFKPIKNAIYIGINKAFAFDKVTLDYLFMQDYTGLRDYIEQSFPYKNRKLIRFYGIEPSGHIDNFVIPESVAIRHNALRYYCHASCSETPELPDVFAYDLCVEELYCKGSTVFAALQFALWTNPKRIYLVGCDCSNAGHFDNSNGNDMGVLLEPYKKFKSFASTYYPETEIISVNPVGLRGLFKDLDQHN